MNKNIPFKKAFLDAAMGLLSASVMADAGGDNWSLSGWINQGVTYADDGTTSDIVSVADNGTTLGSRLTFAGSTDLPGGTNAGFEVIYSGLRQTPQQVAAAALQEDVRAVGLSILSGAHNALLPEIKKLLADQGADDILVFAGGIIPERDIASLREAGIDEIFLPGTSTGTIVEYLNRRLSAA